MGKAEPTIEELEKEYNDALEERDAARERAVVAKRALDAALQAKLAEDIAAGEAAKAGGTAAEVELRTAIVED